VPKLHLQIPYPAFIESIVVYFLLRRRKKRYGYAFRKIKLTKSQFAIVDPEDYEKINQYKWYAKFNGYTFYAERSERIQNSEYSRQNEEPTPTVSFAAAKKTKRGGLCCAARTIRMHRQIMNAPKEKVVDHQNHNGLDNRKANLQLVTVTENNWNSRRGMNMGSSKYKGVNYDKQHKKYRATLCHNGGKIHLGYFDDEIKATKTYDNAVKKYRGKFAIVNLK
jgi:hypothetical protein